MSPTTETHKLHKLYGSMRTHDLEILRAALASDMADVDRDHPMRAFGARRIELIDAILLGRAKGRRRAPLRRCGG